MSRMKSLSSFLAMAMLVTMVSFAHAQSATTAASSAASSAKKTATTAAKDTKAAAATTAKDTKAAAATTAKETKKEAAAKASEMAKYDINTASKDDLMKIPGIAGPTADKIIAGRPWKAKNDLVNKGVMNSAMYKKASPYMIAKAAAK